MSIRINIDKAKEIQRARWRTLREPKLAALDVRFMRALEQGNTAELADIATEKQALRDVTSTLFPSDDPADIAAFIPSILL